MRQNLLDLYQIQKIDLTIHQREGQRAQIPRQLHDHEAALSRLTAQRVQLTERRDATEREVRALQTTIETDRDKIRKWESRLGELRNQREYQALHRETEGQRRANRDNEEKLQEHYKQQTEQTEQLAALDDQLTQAQARIEAEQAAVKGQLDALDANLSELRAKRDVLLPRVPKALFRKYDTIRARRMGQGMSLVSDGCCVGCNMRLPPQLYNTLQRGDTAEQCPSCHRIICWDQLLSPEQADEAAQLVGQQTGAGASAAAQLS